MLINCVAYKNGLHYQKLTLHQLKESLANPEIVIWVGLSDPTLEEIELVKNEFNLHPLAIEDVIHGFQRVKIEEYSEVIFSVLRSPELDEKKINFGDVYLFVGPRFILSIRKNLEKGFANIRQRCETEPHLLAMGSGFIFYSIIDTIVDRFFPIVDELEADFEALEEEIFQKSTSQHHVESLYRLKQKLMQMKHAINPMIEVVGKLHGGRVPKVCAETQEYFRDINDHLFRLEVSIENIREMLVTAIQVNLTLISLRESEVNKKLASWAALIGFPTMFAGIYGMNFKHMPELDWEWGYPLVVLFMVVIDLYLFRRFKKMGWV